MNSIIERIRYSRRYNAFMQIKNKSEPFLIGKVRILVVGHARQMIT